MSPKLRGEGGRNGSYLPSKGLNDEPLRTRSGGGKRVICFLKNSGPSISSPASND